MSKARKHSRQMVSKIFAPTHCICLTSGKLGKAPGKPIAMITAAEVPRGIDIYNIGCSCGFWTKEKYEYAIKYGEDAFNEVCGIRITEPSP